MRTMTSKTNNNKNNKNNNDQAKKKEGKEGIRMLGAVARARRIAAKTNRREIVVLESTTGNDALVLQKAATNNNQQHKKKPATRQTTILPKRKRTKTTATRRNPRKRKHPSSDDCCGTTRNNSHSDGRNNNNNTIDDWCPSVSHLLSKEEETAREASKSASSDDDDEKEEATTTTTKQKRKRSLSSTLVRLHGLPVGTKSNHVRRFFSGLEPDRVLVLPTNRAPIASWDAIVGDDDDDDNHHHHNNGRPLQERYDHRFRLFVQFSSASVASLACERSGETLFFASSSSSGVNKKNDTSNTNSNANNKKEAILGASIAVTMVPKQTATFLLNRMALDVESGSPVDSILFKCERHLPPMVLSVLWTSAYRALKLDRNNNTTDDGIEENLRYQPLFLRKKKNPSRSTNSRAVLPHWIACHNQLVRDYETLLNHRTTGISFDACITGDPEITAQDPIVRLTENAIHCLLDAIERYQEAIQIQTRLFCSNNDDGSGGGGVP